MSLLRDTDDDHWPWSCLEVLTPPYSSEEQQDGDHSSCPSVGPDDPNIPQRDNRPNHNRPNPSDPNTRHGSSNIGLSNDGSQLDYFLESEEYMTNVPNAGPQPPPLIFAEGNESAEVAPAQAPMMTQSMAPAQAPVITQVLAPAQAPMTTQSVAPAQAPMTTQSVAPAQAPVTTQMMVAAQAPMTTQMMASAQAPVTTRMMVAAQAPVTTRMMASAQRPIVVPTEEDSIHDHDPLEGMQPTSVGLPVANSQSPHTFQTGNFLVQGVPLYTTPIQQTSPMSQQLQVIISGSGSQKGGGVVDVPALTDMEGEYGFSVTIEEKERTTKSPMWLMSNITNKLYTNINKAVPFEIHLKKKFPSDQFHIRAVAVFSSAQFLRTNVTRCPNHASTADITNHDFPYPAHVVRADHPEAQYDESPNGRLSVVVPLDILQDGSDFTPILLRFMCLGSCVGGINRRPIAIILTLENTCGQILGRKVIDVRVCACPTRDIRTDEQTHLNKGTKRRGSTQQEKTLTPIRKKPKAVEPKAEPRDDDTIRYIPVRGDKLYSLLMMMKSSYYKTHPEYAAKYPDDISFQNEEDSEDELKGNSLQGLDIGDSEAVTWDSGGGYPHRVGFNNESQLEIVSGPKNNSPLSKLTPNISISSQVPLISSQVPLRLWHKEVDDDFINCSPEESIEYPHSANASGVIFSCSKSIGNAVNSDSISMSYSSSVLKQNSIGNISKHIPVMQVQSYKPGVVPVKTKPVIGLKRNLHSTNREEEDMKAGLKKNRGETIKRSYSPLDEPYVNMYEQNISEDYMSPGSPEMLAANVLVEGFKSKIITNQ